MSQTGDNDLTVPVREPGSGGIQAGETRTATVTNVQTRVVDKQYLRDSDEDALYLDITLQDDQTGYEFEPGFSLGPVSNPGVSESTELGGLLMDLGASLQTGSEVSIDDYIHPGVAFDFEVIMEEDEEGDEWPRADKETLRPEGEGQAQLAGASGSGDEPDDDGQDDEEDDMTADVLTLVENYQGKPESTVKAQLINENNEFLSVYNNLKEQGVIEIDDGEVMLA